ncbi:DNA repair protein RadC [Flavobacterium sp. 28YEA47A]|uniref:RadC family protein n=1 Tax=Flavobacterium sp. 28YEA47A TaxID=3156276 RepID=UPI0035180B49
MQENKKAPSIKNWAEDDKPREKLKLKGKEALSNAELVAILIRAGNHTESAVTLSKRILADVKSLNAMGKISIEQLVAYHGIGEAKAITIIAAMELGRRRRSEETVPLKRMTSGRIVFEAMQPIIGELSHEEFWILYLNNSNRIIHKYQLSKGGITGTVVDMRLVFKVAIVHNATSIILAHNHPSGVLYPSESDRIITKKLKIAGENLDIRVLDHVIITENAYYSFRDEGTL